LTNPVASELKEALRGGKNEFHRNAG
jgi:hypothetical protein